MAPKFPHKTDFVRGEIVLLDLDTVPPVGHPQEGITEKRNNPDSDGRPCIILRPLKRTLGYGLTTVVPMRTKKLDKKLYPGDVEVPKIEGVPEDSVAEVSQLRSADLNVRLLAWFAPIDETILAKIDKEVKKLLQLK